MTGATSSRDSLAICRICNKVKLRERFESFEQPTDEFFRDTAGYESRRVVPIQDAIGNLVLKGGERPDLDALVEVEGLYPEEYEEEYVPPGLPEVLAPDDPALEYEADEWDWRI